MILFKLILIALLSVSIYAAERPKIGLVLSGGGARGGAHLGVIKEFEKHHIPIDGIVGTSMGAFIGGLYASGMSSQEIERRLTTTKWDEVIVVDYDRTQIPFRRKKLQHDFPGKLKVGINKDNDIVIGAGVFKRQMMLQYLEEKTHNISYIHDFDKLRIPFRAVASNLENGERVVLGSGSLAESIYASIAIPGGFDPIVIDGKTLVDGGVADNLPLDVMREEMEMDIIVVIDISTPFDKDARFENIISVLGQLSNILMRKNVEQTVASMKENEILITPDLKKYTPLDADKYAEIIKIGEKTIEHDYASKLANLSLDDEAYARYLEQINPANLHSCPVIDKIEIDNQTYLNDETIRSYLHVKTGEQLDFDQLNKDVKVIYNLMIFDDVKYSIVTIDDITTLKITATPSWDVNGQLKFAFGFEDNFNGHSDYSVKLEYIMFGLNSYGGEWRSRFSIGIERLAYTEWYQPLDVLQKWYIRPNIFYRDKKIYLSPDVLGAGDDAHNSGADLDDSIPAQAKEYGAEFGFGVNITNNLQAEVSLIAKNVSPSIDLLTLINNGDQNSSYKYSKRSKSQDILQAHATVRLDSLNDAFFPTQGYAGVLNYFRQMSEWGSDAEFSQLFAKISAAYSFGYHTFYPTLKSGLTFKSEAFDSSQDFNAFYTLGGLFNLSGLPTNAMAGDQMLFGSLVYRYRLTQEDFFGALSMPLYAGFSLEAGDTWYKEHKELQENADIIFAGSAYLAADTVIGPMYLGVGAADGEYYSVYFSLGHEF